MKPRDFLLGSQIKNIPQTWAKAYVLKESYDDLKAKLDIAREFIKGFKYIARTSGDKLMVEACDEALEKIGPSE